MMNQAREAIIDEARITWGEVCTTNVDYQLRIPPKPNWKIDIGNGAMVITHHVAKTAQRLTTLANGEVIMHQVAKIHGGPAMTTSYVCVGGPMDGNLISCAPGCTSFAVQVHPPPMTSARYSAAPVDITVTQHVYELEYSDAAGGLAWVFKS